MTALNKQALRQKAEKAGVEEWQSRKIPGSAGECTVIVKGSLKKHPGWTTCRPVADDIVDKKAMDFIAAANPATVLALIDGLEAAEKRIAELEAREVAVKQFDDFQIVHYGAAEDYAKGYIDCQNNYNKALTAAGIGVKGE